MKPPRVLLRLNLSVIGCRSTRKMTAQCYSQGINQQKGVGKFNDIREIKHRVFVKRRTRNGGLPMVIKACKCVIRTRLSVLKRPLILAANSQEMSSYQTSFFHFWQNANFSSMFAVCRKRDG